jgi:hypothetical protein
MNRFHHSLVRALLGLLVLLSLSACGDDEAQWDTRRDALFGAEKDEEHSDARWQIYRDEIVEGLDLMRTALSEARTEGTVVDRPEIESLDARVVELRDEMASNIDQPSDDDRRQLRASFESVRADVDELLTRLGHDPDDIARWQDQS